MDARKPPSFDRPPEAWNAPGTTGSVPGDQDKKRAIAGLAGSLDVSFFKAIAEPVRQKIIFILLNQGRSNVQQVAQHMVQDRSVVSRHLAFLEQAGFVRSYKIQRYTVYELDGPSIIHRLEEVLSQLRAAAAVCCPAPKPLSSPSELSRPDDPGA